MSYRDIHALALAGIQDCVASQHRPSMIMDEDPLGEFFFRVTPSPFSPILSYPQLHDLPHTTLVLRLDLISSTFALPRSQFFH